MDWYDLDRERWAGFQPGQRDNKTGASLTGIYLDFVEDSLRAERDRRATLEARGVSIVAQAGGLVTLLAGVGTLFIGNRGSALTLAAILPLMLALIFFVLAVIFGILVSFSPLYPRHPVADKETMTKMRTSKRDDTDDDARSAVAHIHIQTIEALRKGNRRRIWWIVAAQVCQVLAVVSLSVAVAVTALMSTSPTLSEQDGPNAQEQAQGPRILEPLETARQT